MERELLALRVRLEGAEVLKEEDMLREEIRILGLRAGAGSIEGGLETGVDEEGTVWGVSPSMRPRELEKEAVLAPREYNHHSRSRCWFLRAMC